MYEVTCQHCQNIFFVKERRHFDGNRKRKFCSLKCAGPHIYNARKDIISITSFKKGHPPYNPSPNKIKIKKPPRLLFGKDNPSYIHGKKCGNREKLYKRLAFENHEKHCVICKTKKILHVHHINGDHFDHSLNNLCILCNSCHQRFHRCQIKLPNPHIISKQIEDAVNALNLKNEFLKCKRKRYLLRKALTNPNHASLPIY